MFETGLYSLLAASADITAIVDPGSLASPPTARADGSSGVFAMQLPEATPMPALQYQSIAALSVNSFDGANRFQKRRIQFDCYARSALAAKQLAGALKNLLLGYSGELTDGSVINSVIFNLEIDFFEDAPFLYRTMVDLDIWFQAA